MEFRVLGPLEVRGERGVVAVGGARRRAVLAVLLLHANEAVSSERLAVALWGEDARAGAVNAVQVHVSRLRKALGDPGVLETTPAGYRLRVGPGELDRERFERLVEEGRRGLVTGEADRARVVLREALSLWRGRPLEDVAFESFAATEVARLEEPRLAAVELRVQADLASGRDAEVIGELKQLVAEHPTRERLHAQLMLALYRCGRQADALEAYRSARRVLVEELGIEPGSELRDLERAILAHDPELDLAASPDTDDNQAASAVHEPRVAARRARVPMPPTPTVGRDEDLRRLRGLVDDPSARLVTVVGPGGVGKTRVAVELARTVASEQRDEAGFVSLAALSDHEHVTSAIARALDITVFPSESVSDALVRHLEERQLLLVLDNFEHVLDAAPLVAELLAAAPGVTVLATSREPLRLRAERLFSLHPLAIWADSTAAAGPALALFEAVAQAKDRGFQLTPSNESAAVEICRRMDGLPLAIELAAGRLGLLSLSDLAGRLRDSMEVLGPGPRDAPARQRTLIATLHWSYALLTPAEQHALSALAVFAGGCTIDAAQAVADAPLDVLEALVDKNLIVAPRAVGGNGRFTMLETVRAFAAERMRERSDADLVRKRHCEHYVRVAEHARPELERCGSLDLLAQLDRELDNFRVAFAWSVSRPAPVLALRLATAVRATLGRWRFDSGTDGWPHRALALSGENVPPSVRAAALEAYAYAVDEKSTGEHAEAAARESLALRRSTGDRTGAAASLRALARALSWKHRDDDAYRYAGEAVRLATESGDELTRIDALAVMAECAPTIEQALALSEEPAAAFRANGNQLALEQLLTGLTYAALGLGDHRIALRLGAEALAIAEALGAPGLPVYALGNAALSALFNGDADRARAWFVRQLRLVEQHRHYRLVHEPLIGLAAVAALEGRDELAAMLHGAADAASLERPHPGVVRELNRRCFRAARDRLGEHGWQAAYAVGAQLDRDQAIHTALQSMIPDEPHHCPKGLARAPRQLTCRTQPRRR